MLSPQNGLLDRRVIRNHLSWRRQGGLENTDHTHVGGGQFVHHSVTIRVYVQTKAFLGLDAMVVIVSVVGELAQGDGVTRLVERPNNEAGGLVRATRNQAGCYENFDP